MEAICVCIKRDAIYLAATNSDEKVVYLYALYSQCPWKNYCIKQKWYWAIGKNYVGYSLYIKDTMMDIKCFVKVIQINNTKNKSLN